MPADLTPVTTRSALLTLMMGAEEEPLGVRELAAAAAAVGFAEATVRVALSRMATAGDVVRDDDGRYRLSERLLHRSRRQEAATRPARRDWHGGWDMVVVTTVGRGAADRAELRTTLTDLRLAELREGVWVRPDNLHLDWPAVVQRDCVRFTAGTEGIEGSDPVALASRLWDLEAWAERARALLDATATTDPALRFTACATAGRHLLADPVLPAELLPADWPGEELRSSHVAYKTWINEVRRAAARD